MPTRNINLTEHYDQFVEEQIDAGRYSNASEVLRAGLRLLEQKTLEESETIQMLRTVAAQAFDEIDQGKGIEIRNMEQLKKLIAGLGRQAAAKGRRSGKAG